MSEQSWLNRLATVKYEQDVVLSWIWLGKFRRFYAAHKRSTILGLGMFPRSGDTLKLDSRGLEDGNV